MQFHVLLFLSGVFYCYGFNINDFFLAKDAVIVKTKANEGEECPCDEYYPVSGRIMKFRVTASSDAHIVLSNTRNDTLPIVEVIIGASKNTLIVIRKDKNKSTERKETSDNILSASQFRGFWVSWEGGISVGKEGENTAIASWPGDQTLDVKYFGLCTAGGASGTWEIQCMKITKSQLSVDKMYSQQQKQLSGYGVQNELDTTLLIRE